jgi:hypothetical protein
MDIDKFIMEIKAVGWHSFKGDFYVPESVPLSLISLALPEQESKEGIYPIAGITPDVVLNPPIKSAVMFAIGNDHRGTYDPVIREALPFIIQIALSGNHVVSRNCAINILLDLYFFYPADRSDELLKFVRKTIRDAIIENRESFSKFAVDDTRNKSLIESLLSIVDEEED